MTIRRLSRALLVAALTLLGMGSTAVYAVPTYYNGNYYEYIFSPDISWTAAQSAATGLGSGWDLVSITSSAENTFVISLLGTAAGERNHVWIGGNDVAAEGTYVWSNGDAFSYTNWHSLILQEPNDSDGITVEDYIAFDYRSDVWAWNDVYNEGYQVRGYIVEKIPEPSTLAILGIGLLGLGAMCRRRKAKA